MAAVARISRRRSCWRGAVAGLCALLAGRAPCSAAWSFSSTRPQQRHAPSSTDAADDPSFTRTPPQDRRTWLLQTGTAATSAAVLSSLFLATVRPGHAAAQTEFATQAGRRGCTTVSDPSKTVVTCTGELYGDNEPRRLSSIAATENGVSTSAVRNPSAYMAPWSYLPETGDPIKAWRSLAAAVRNVDPRATIVEDTGSGSNRDSSGNKNNSNNNWYLHATVPTRQPPGLLDSVDDLEFVLRPDDNLVLFRSASRAAVFVYPLTQPVSDRSSNRKRMDAIRNALGWQELN